MRQFTKEAERRMKELFAEHGIELVPLVEDGSNQMRTVNDDGSVIDLETLK